MVRSTVVRRTLALAGTGMLAGLGLLAAAGPAAADAAPAAPPVAAVVIAQYDTPGSWTWCPYGNYWHHEGLLSGLLDGTGHLLGALL